MVKCCDCDYWSWDWLDDGEEFQCCLYWWLHKPKSILTLTPTILVGNTMIGIVNILKKENGDELYF